MKYLGVITGDIVDSRAIDPKNRKKLYADLASFLNSMKKNSWISGYELFRGDSFQCVVEKKELTLRSALMLRSFIKSYELADEKKDESSETGTGKISTKGYFPAKQDFRLSIGIGQVDFYNKKSLAHSDGQAFRFSGEELDNIKKAPYRITLKTFNDKFNESIEPAILLLDAVLQKWTNNQAEIVLYKLQNSKEEEISKALSISKSAVNQRTKSAQWFAIEKLLHYFETSVKDWN